MNNLDPILSELEPEPGPEPLPPEPLCSPANLHLIIVRLEALERQMARIHESDSRMLRAVLAAAAILLLELLSRVLT
jgi:hypothetical protein